MKNLLGAVGSNLCKCAVCYVYYKPWHISFVHKEFKDSQFLVLRQSGHINLYLFQYMNKIPGTRPSTRSARAIICGQILLVIHRFIQPVNPQNRHFLYVSQITIHRSIYGFMTVKIFFINLSFLYSKINSKKIYIITLINSYYTQEKKQSATVWVQSSNPLSAATD